MVPHARIGIQGLDDLGDQPCRIRTGDRLGFQGVERRPVDQVGAHIAALGVDFLKLREDAVGEAEHVGSFRYRRDMGRAISLRIPSARDGRAFATIRTDPE